SSWAQENSTSKPRRIHLHFFRSPVAVRGTSTVEGLVLEQNRLTSDGRLVGTGEYEDINAGLVLAAVGYKGEPVAGLPFDGETGIVPHQEGRVMAGEEPMPGVYVAGWAKRGPSGVI